MSSGRVLAAVLATAALAGCRDEPAQLTRLDGSRETRPTISVPQALAVEAARPALVQGYLIDPFDDLMRLCARPSEGACDGASLRVVGLDVERVEGLSLGCCSVGYWSKHELAVPGTVAAGVLYVGAPPR